LDSYTPKDSEFLGYPSGYSQPNTVEPLPRGWRAVAFPRWLHVQSCSTWLISFIVRCCFGGLCVRDGLASSLCTCRTSAASVGPLSRGSRAVAFPRWLHVLSCSTWLIVHCCIGGLCFGFIGTNSNSMNSIRRAASSGCRGVAYAAEPGATRYSCCATSINKIWSGSEVRSSFRQHGRYFEKMILHQRSLR